MATRKMCNWPLVSGKFFSKTSLVSRRYQSLTLNWSARNFNYDLDLFTQCDMDDKEVFAPTFRCRFGLGHVTVKTRSHITDQQVVTSHTFTSSMRPWYLSEIVHKHTWKLIFTCVKNEITSLVTLHVQISNWPLQWDRVIVPGTFQTPLRGLLRNSLRYVVVGYFPLISIHKWTVVSLYIRL